MLLNVLTNTVVFINKSNRTNAVTQTVAKEETEGLDASKRCFKYFAIGKQAINEMMNTNM